MLEAIGEPGCPEVCPCSRKYRRAWSPPHGRICVIEFELWCKPALLLQLFNVFLMTETGPALVWRVHLPHRCFAVRGGQMKVYPEPSRRDFTAPLPLAFRLKWRSLSCKLKLLREQDKKRIKIWLSAFVAFHVGEEEGGCARGESHGEFSSSAKAIASLSVIALPFSNNWLNISSPSAVRRVLIQVS
jgi:hypothetical protein